MKLNLTQIIAFATLAGVVGGGAVYAQQGSNKRMERAERMFERMDTNKDGIATAQDAVALVAARFSAMDMDNNGEVTRAERKQFRQARLAERNPERFARLDTNGDGQISQEEMQAKRKAGGKRGNGKRQADKRGPVTLQMMQDRALERFARIDVDGDGQITLTDVKIAKPSGRKN